MPGPASPPPAAASSASCDETERTFCRHFAPSSANPSEFKKLVHVPSSEVLREEGLPASQGTTRTWWRQAWQIRDGDTR